MDIRKKWKSYPQQLLAFFGRKALIHEVIHIIHMDNLVIIESEKEKNETFVL